MKAIFWCFLTVALLLLMLLGIGIFARVIGVAEGTEIIFAALAGIGILIENVIRALRSERQRGQMINTMQTPKLLFGSKAAAEINEKP